MNYNLDVNEKISIIVQGKIPQNPIAMINLQNNTTASLMFYKEPNNKGRFEIHTDHVVIRHSNDRGDYEEHYYKILMPEFLFKIPYIEHENAIIIPDIVFVTIYRFNSGELEFSYINEDIFESMEDNDES